MTTASGWSYSAGERGRNRVRVFENRHGTLYVEFYESGPDEQTRPRRYSLRHQDRRKAKQQADEIAVRLGAMEMALPADITLQQLFDNYVNEVSRRTKGKSKRAHDERSAHMFTRFFGGDRRASSLNVRDWNDFIVARREGTIGPSPERSRPVRDRQIEYDLKFLLAVLNWATKARVDGERLLECNPLKGLNLPKEKNPRRPIIDDETYLMLWKVAASIDWRFETALVLAHETGHRIGAIRRLQWKDVDLDQELVTWRASNDKGGVEHTTPLTSEAVAVIKLARARGGTIGDSWVLPSPRFPARAVSGHVLYKWLKKALEKSGLGQASGIGYHCFRRKFATELKGIALKDLMALGGWKDPKTVLSCYQQTDVESLRNALGERVQSTHQSTHLGHCGRNAG
jgi:integrase